MFATLHPTPRSTPSPRFTLDDLARKTYAELEALYRNAPAPTSLHAADGKLTGRMLAFRHAERGVLGRFMRGLALSPRFVWEGKTFSAVTPDRGGGYNRICVEGVLGRQHMFPFDSRIEPSLFDGRPTIVIDYDRPTNPWFMRRIHDEIREVSPGMFLGIDMWKTAKRSIGVVWFALAVP
jgi:hypothetical protein